MFLCFLPPLRNFIYVIHAMQELHDVQLFFSQHNITGTVKCTPLSAVVFRSAVLNAGYRISSTHVNPLGLKSDAPWDVIWDILRCWVNLIKLFSLWYSDDCMSRILLLSSWMDRIVFFRSNSAVLLLR
jgi:hypothetical protein